MAELEKITAVFEAEDSDMLAAFEKIAAKAEATAQRITERFNKVGESFQNVGKKMSLFVTAPLVALGTLAVRAWEKQEDAIARVNVALRATGGAVGFTTDELVRMSEALQKRSIFGDDDILGEATVTLLKFQSISGQVFERAQQAVVDYASQTQTSLSAAAQQIGRALEDPIAGMTLLRRAGIVFSEEQQEVIKSLVEQGKTLEAQKLILAGFESKFVGAAETIAQTTSGRIKQAMNAFGDALEVVGEVISRVLVPVADRVKELAEAFQRLTPETQKFIVIGAAFAAALGPILVGLGLMIRSIGAVIAIVTLFSRTFAAVVKAVISGIGLLLAGFAGIPISIGLALAATLGGVYLFRNTIIETFKAIIDGIALFFVKGFVNDVQRPFLQALNDLISLMPGSVSDFLGLSQIEVPPEVTESVGDLFSEGFARAKAAAEKDLEDVKNLFIGMAKDVQDSVLSVLPQGAVDLILGGENGDTEASVARIQAVADAARAALDEATGGGVTSEEAKDRAKRTAETVRGLQVEIAALTGKLGELTPEMAATLDGLGALNYQFERGRIVGAEFNDTAANLVQLLSDADAARLAAQLIEETATEQERFNEKFETYVDLLARGLINQETFNRAFDAARRQMTEFGEAKAVIDSIKTAQELYNDELERLTDLFQKGFLSLDQYHRAINRAGEELKKATDQTKEATDWAKELGQTFESAFENAIVEGKSFREILHGIEQDLIRIFIRTQVTKPLMGALEGILGNLFNPTPSGFPTGATTSGFSGLLSSGRPLGFAGGGDTPANRMMLVGEHGPELFLSKSPGRIIPNPAVAGAMSGGGGSNVQVNVYAPPGSSVEQSRSRRGNMDELNLIIDKAVASNLRPGTSTFRALRDQFGASPRVIQR